jgi:hypothetical protein
VTSDGSTCSQILVNVISGHGVLSTRQLLFHIRKVSDSRLSRGKRPESLLKQPWLLPPALLHSSLASLNLCYFQNNTTAFLAHVSLLIPGLRSDTSRFLLPSRSVYMAADRHRMPLAFTTDGDKARVWRELNSSANPPLLKTIDTPTAIKQHHTTPCVISPPCTGSSRLSL